MRNLRYLGLVFVLSCHTTSHPDSSAKVQNQERLVSAEFHASSAHLHFIGEEPQNSDFRRITVCDADASQCRSLDTVRNEEIVTLPVAGKGSIKVEICTGPECRQIRVFDEFVAKQVSQDLRDLDLKIDQTQRDLSKQLAAARETLRNLLNSAPVSTSEEGRKSVQYLLALSDPALTYVLTNLSELPMDASASLNLATTPTASSNSSLDKQTEKEVGVDLVKTGWVLSGMAVGFGFLALLNRDGKFYSYVAPEKKPAIGTTAVPANNFVAQEKNLIHFKGLEFELPLSYELVNPVREPGGDTKALGKGSQGTVFMITDGKTKKIVKLSNNVADIASDKTALESLEHEFIRDDVDVAKAMEAGFQNPMEAKLVKVKAKDSQGRALAHDIPVVTKDLVEGTTLKKAIENQSFFADKEMQDDIPKLIQRMCADKRVYEDLNPDNLIYNPKLKKWIVIDAKPPRVVATTKEAFDGNMESVLNKLPVDSHGRVFARDGVREFIDVANYVPKFADAKVKLAADERLMFFHEQWKDVEVHYMGEGPLPKTESLEGADLGRYERKLEANIPLRAFLATAAIAWGIEIAGLATTAAASAALAEGTSGDEIIGLLGKAKAAFATTSQNLDNLVLRYWQSDQPAI